MIRKITKRITALALAAALLGLSACAEKPSRLATAAAFVETVLTIPDPAIAELADPLNMPTEPFGDGQLAVPTEEYNDELRRAIGKFCGKVIAKEEMTDLASPFFQTVMILHISAARSDSTANVKSVSVKEVSEEKFAYEATLTTSYTDEPVTVIGAIYFNEDGLINFMNIESISEYPPPPTN